MTTEETSAPKRRWSVPFVILVSVIVISLGGHYAYKSLTGLPRRVRIATGVAGGRYRAVMESLGQTLAARTGIKVDYIETDGSLDNIKQLESGQVDFALFQSGAQDLRHDNAEAAYLKLRSVANVYSEVVHILVHRKSGIRSAADLRGKRISLGGPSSGDNVSARIVLEHMGIKIEDIEPKGFDYDTLLNEFKNENVDAAFATVGLGTKKIQQIIRQANVEIIPVSFSNRLTIRNLSVELASIPAGMYQVEPVPIPASDIETVSMRAQLLTRENVSLGLVEQVAAIMMDQNFQRKQRLRELFSDGAKFARDKTMYALHDGAANHFDPELKPLLPPDFVEATEGLRSFVVSILIAAYLGFRWFKKHQTRSHDHSLDKHIKALLQIERDQMDLDEQIGISEIQQLQKLLDDVTKLRQAALGELSAHELTDDSAAPVFIQMCHALSEKISAKLSRQRIDLRLTELIKSNDQASDSK
jgi:uncharacterized protein